MQVRKREFWNSAEPERLPDEFVMTKPQGDHTCTAVCECWVVDLGWDLRLMIDGHGLLLSSLARSGRELVDTVEKWKANDRSRLAADQMTRILEQRRARAEANRSATCGTCPFIDAAA